MAILQKYTAVQNSEFLLDGGESISLMRMFHYFFNITKEVIQTSANEDSGLLVFGSSPHTDWGILTVILQDSTGGLQYHYNGEWLDVDPLPNSFVINAGDYLNFLSGGRYHSPVHRVLAPTSTDRFSFVLFFYPRYDAPLTEAKVRVSDSSDSSCSGDGDSSCGISSSSGAVGGGGGNREGVGIDIGHNSLFRMVCDGSYPQDKTCFFDENKKKSFGDYIVKKWLNVYRPGNIKMIYHTQK